MKIILSRKGFDSSYGGCPSPVLPDGTMLSMPIPSDNELSFDSIKYKDQTYLEILKQLKPKRKDWDTLGCHLDPDLRGDIRKEVCVDWKPAFGQIGASQTHLENQNVKAGDLFLFFGWFRNTVYRGKDTLKYDSNCTDKHMLFGYLQIGEIIQGNNTKKYYWHPHSGGEYANSNNTIYVASKELVINGNNTNLPGAGTFKYSDSLVLTKNGYSRSRWNLPDFFKTTSISYHNEKSFKEDYFQSVAIGQEFVVSESEMVTEWAYNLIKNHVQCK